MNFLEEGVRMFSEERCRGCGARGEGLLCPVCTGVIVETGRARKIKYEDKMVAKPREVFEGARYLGERDGILGELAEEYKYMSRRGMEKVLAEIVDEVYFKKFLFGKKGKAEAILVPMPTARKHIRSRGLDHIARICAEIARRDERVEVVRLLERRKDTVQVGANEEKRKAQAKEAVGVDFLEVEKAKKQIFSAEESSEKEAGRGIFKAKKRGRKTERGRAIVVMDDVWTTGASLLYAGKKLKEAGVEEFGEMYALAITKNRAGRSPEIYFGKF